ncbi:DNA repair protein RecO, partial [Aegicerativicinus sediminis]
MYNSTKAIVLSKVKYGDNDLIVKCYTETDGLVSYFLRGVLNSKAKRKQLAYYQLLGILEIIEYSKANSELKFIREVKPLGHFHSLHSNVIKGSVVMFLAEMLSSVLREEEQNSQLFQYLETSINWLEQEDHFSNFHLLFLLNLTKFLGFYPETTNIGDATSFDLETGRFVIKSNSRYVIEGENFHILKALLGINFDVLNDIKINANQRQSFLKMLLLYYQLHLGNFRNPRSLEIFNQ